MSLQGTLGDFGVADLLQLIGSQAKTGALLVKGPSAAMRVAFVEGNVVAAHRVEAGAIDPVASGLLRAGLLTHAQLARALDVQQHTMRRAANVLVDEGTVTREALASFARLLTTESVCALQEWKTGTYAFSAQPVHPGEILHEPLRTDALLMEGFRRVDELPALREVIPSSSVSFVIVGELPAMAASTTGPLELDRSDRSRGQPARPLGAAERPVFTVVAPGRTVAVIAERSLLGEFEATKALVALVQAGVLEIVAAPAGAAATPSTTALSPPSTRAVVLASLSQLLASALTSLLIAALVGGLVRASNRVVALDAASVRAEDAGREALAVVARHRLSAALAIARAESGRYPERLEDLVAAGLLTDHDLAFPFAASWAYRAVTAEDRYELAPPLR